MQLADTGIEVLELIPPAVRTTLMGHQDNEQAVPLDAFLDEVMEILANNDHGGEIVVAAAKFFRFAEARGQYQDVLQALSNYTA